MWLEHPLYRSLDAAGLGTRQRFGHPRERSPRRACRGRRRPHAPDARRQTRASSGDRRAWDTCNPQDRAHRARRGHRRRARTLLPTRLPAHRRAGRNWRSLRPASAEHPCTPVRRHQPLGIGLAARNDFPADDRHEIGCGRTDVHEQRIRMVNGDGTRGRSPIGRGNRQGLFAGIGRRQKRPSTV